MGDSAYSFSLTTFSRTGKLLQIEYALQAVANGRSSLGIQAKNGVVVATDKKVGSTLIDLADVQKIESLTPASGVVYSGLGPDYRVLLRNARKSSLAYKGTYGEYPGVKTQVRDLAGTMQEYTQSGGVRPFGVSLLVAGWDADNGPSLYQVDPSGAFYAWKATAIGE
jgi:20S proteasome subunit alpha 2